MLRHDSSPEISSAVQQRAHGIAGFATELSDTQKIDEGGQEEYRYQGRRLRVAVITQYFPTSEQPWAGQTAYQTLRVLANRCEVHVFYPEAVYPPLLTPPSSRRGPLDFTWSPPGVETTYISYPALPVISRHLNGFSMARRVLPYVRQFAPDIVLSYTVYPDGYAAVRVARKLGIPSVITAIGSDLNRIPDAICKMLTQKALSQATFVSTVSHDLCKTARTMGADTTHSAANLNGCSTSTFYPRDMQKSRRALGIDPQGDVIVFVGRLDVRKGLLELIEAVAQLLPTRPSLRCYIVGGGADHALLKAAIERAGISEAIALVPSAPTHKIALWMSAASLVALPSYNEGCPNVVIESLASGRPVVATRVGGIPELMDEKSGRLVLIKDVPALKQALDEVLSQSWNAQEIAAAHCRDWTNVADELYRTLLKTLVEVRA